MRTSEERPLPKFFERIVKANIKDPDPSIFEKAREVFNQEYLRAASETKIKFYPGSDDQKLDRFFADLPDNAYSGPMLLVKYPWYMEDSFKVDDSSCEEENNRIDLFYVNPETGCIGLAQIDKKAFRSTHTSLWNDTQQRRGNSIYPNHVHEAALRFMVNDESTEIDDNPLLPLSAGSPLAQNVIREKSKLDAFFIVDRLEGDDAVGSSLQDSLEGIQDSLEDTIVHATTINFSAKFMRFRQSLDPDITQVQDMCAAHDTRSYNWLAGNGDPELSHRRKQAACQFPQSSDLH